MKKSFIILGPGHICAQNILENLKTTKKCVFFFSLLLYLPEYIVFCPVSLLSMVCCMYCPCAHEMHGNSRLA